MDQDLVQHIFSQMQDLMFGLETHEGPTTA